MPNPLPAASGEPLIVLLEGGERREIVTVLRTGVELVSIRDLLPGFGTVSMREDSRARSLTLSVEGRDVTLYDKKSLASVGGDLRLLSSPVLVEDGRWLVPVDSLSRLLGPLLKKRVDFRPASRVLLVGNVDIARILVKTSVSGDSVRVALESSQKVPFHVEQQAGRVVVTIPHDVVDVAYQQDRLTGGIVDLIQYLGGKEHTFAFSLGQRFQQLKAVEETSPPRLVLDFQARPVAPGVAGPVPLPSAAPSPTAPIELGGVRTVVIDPGHGGEEVGAKGPSGALEKDVTLAIARKLRSALANSLGLQAFLTRDRDEEIALDERAAVANNYKADLFVSIHANASRSLGAKGSEVYFLTYQATDDESRRMAALEGGAFTPGTPAPASGDLALILWDMAQAEHLEESSALASRIQEELAEVTGSQGRGVKQAPFRVLVGAAMPAVLVEVAFISNAEEERLLVSDSYQGKVVAALVRGISRYQQQHRADLGGAHRP
jgi:N-acetylmuramoyl-L-alanine amidase